MSHSFFGLDNLRSLMWGVRSKARRWWLPILKRFYHQQRLGHLVGLSNLKAWVNEGKLKAVVLKEEWADSDLKFESQFTISTTGGGGA